jgi:multiple antibiotic resistance protein
VFSDDLARLVAAILTVVGAILPIVNPPGDASLFLQLTADCDDATRRDLARRVAVYSFGLLLGSLLIGPLALRLFDLSLAVIQVAGGAVVVAFGWDLLNQEPKEPGPADVAVDARRASLRVMGQAFYPLAMPLTVDPGAMAVAVTIGANHAHKLDRLLIQFLAAVIGAAIVALAVLLTYRYAEQFAERIGQQGMVVVLRLSAFIVLSIGVQIAWNGVKELLRDVGVST